MSNSTPCSRSTSPTTLANLSVSPNTENLAQQLSVRDAVEQVPTSYPSISPTIRKGAHVPGQRDEFTSSKTPVIPLTDQTLLMPSTPIKCQTEGNSENQREKFALNFPSTNEYTKVKNFIVGCISQNSHPRVRFDIVFDDKKNQISILRSLPKLSSLIPLRKRNEITKLHKNLVKTLHLLKLFDAIKSENIEDVHEALKSGVEWFKEWKSYTAQDQSPMEIAVTLNNLAIVDVLMGLGWNYPEEPPIFLAIRLHRIDIVRHFIHKEQKFDDYYDNSVDQKGVSIQEALEEWKDEDSKMLLDAISSVTSSKNLLIDFVQGKIQTLPETVKNQIKANPEMLCHRWVKDFDVANTLLLEAVLQGHSYAVEQLIELDTTKKSLDVTDSFYAAHNAPLLLACKIGHSMIANCLIKAGANPNCQDYRGFTPLHWASILRDNDLICILLAYGADPQIKDAFGQDSLFYYLKVISKEDVRFVISKAIGIPHDFKGIPDYCSSGVSFKTQNDANFYSEGTRHEFSTKFRNLSDIHWHCLKIVMFQGWVRESYDKKMKYSQGMMNELRSRAKDVFCENRNKRPYLPEIVDQMKNASNALKSPVSPALPFI